MQPGDSGCTDTISHGFQKQFQILKTSESIAAQGFADCLERFSLPPKTVLCGIQSQKISGIEIINFLLRRFGFCRVSQSQPLSVLASNDSVIQNANACWGILPQTPVCQRRRCGYDQTSESCREENQRHSHETFTATSLYLHLSGKGSVQYNHRALLWISGAWGRSLPASSCTLSDKCIACHDEM